MKIEKLFHHSQSKLLRNWIIAIGGSFTIILVNNLANDLIENLKIGSLFFFMIALMLVIEQLTLPRRITNNA